MYEEEIKMLLVKPGRYPETIIAPQTLESLQKLVEGDIEIVYPWQDSACIICDDEGKLTGKPLNRPLGDYDVLAGSFLIAGLDGPDFKSLTDDQVKTYEEMFHQPTVFVRTMNGIQAMPCRPDQYDMVQQRMNQHKKARERDPR